MNENRFTFEKIDGYDVITQSEIGSGKELMAKKIEPYAIGESWKRRIGKYQVVNKLNGEVDFFTDFELIEREGLLVMTFRQGNQDIEMAMDMVDESRAVVSGIGRYAGQSLQIKKDRLLFFGLDLQRLN